MARESNTPPSAVFANINAYNLASQGRDWRLGKSPYGPKQYPQKVELISRLLQQMGMPQVVVFEEVFHRDALEDVLKVAGYDGFQIVMPDESGEEPNTAIVTTLPLVEQQLLLDIPERTRDPGENSELYHHFRRPMVHAVVKVEDGLQVDVFGGHLKSNDLVGVSHHFHPKYEGAIGSIKRPKPLIDHLADGQGTVPLSGLDHAVVFFTARFDKLDKVDDF